MSAPDLGIAIGDVIEVAEADYMYGVGRLVLRVAEVDERQAVAGETWVCLRGDSLRADGSREGERFALVRVRGVRKRR
jgi:hypothetical protein